ncbi:MAG: ABC transporter ATP-binding protein [Gammaproteobacteria bacterium]|jgi:iron complex transport system ATP-binding protein|nr:ABC transporter ATP-binding protein [Gammaproteobacteria bacterium]
MSNSSTPPGLPGLQCHDLTIEVAGRTLVADLNLTAAPGQLICVLGTNGVGKTLLLHTLAGLRPAGHGTITLCGSPLASLPRKAIAQRLGLLLQLHDDAFPLTVLETALTGHFARTGWRGWHRGAERRAALAALAAVDLAGFEARSITTLSGGERERLAIATLLVQNPQVWLLDEPANHLDPRHQLAAFELLRRQADSGRSVMATVHNPALAMRFADAALLLFGDGSWAFGPATELLTIEQLEKLYDTPFHRYTGATPANPGATVLLPL